MGVEFSEYRLTQVNATTSVIVTVIIIMIAVCAEQETGLSNVVHKHSLQTAGLQWGSEKDSAGSVWGEGAQKAECLPMTPCRAPGCSTAQSLQTTLTLGKLTDNRQVCTEDQSIQHADIF